LLGGGTVCDPAGQDCGTVFSVTPAGAETVLYAFKGGVDGDGPAAGLLAWRGKFYGTTQSGGAACTETVFGCGTVFSVTPTGSERVIYAFQGGSDGIRPNGGLINEAGILYGLTEGGGSANCTSYPGPGCGTVFSLTRSGSETVLYAFKGGPDGAFPVGNLLAAGGNLLGVTSQGGDFTNCPGGCGTVFSVSPSGVKKVLYAFKGGSDGASPGSGLVQVGSTLYGVTEAGGQYRHGAVFSLRVSPRSYRVLAELSYHHADGGQT